MQSFFILLIKCENVTAEAYGKAETQVLDFRQEEDGKLVVDEEQIKKQRPYPHADGFRYFDEDKRFQETDGDLEG